MAQVTDAVTFKASVVEFSANGSSWTAVSGESGSVVVDGGERATEETHTFDGDVPIVSSGKRGKLSVKVRILYRIDPASGWTMAKTSYEGDSAFYVRWSPEGATSGKKRYTTSAGRVTTQPYPGGEASSAALIATEVNMECATITESTIP